MSNAFGVLLFQQVLAVMVSSDVSLNNGKKAKWLGKGCGICVTHYDNVTCFFSILRISFQNETTMHSAFVLNKVLLSCSLLTH